MMYEIMLIFFRKWIKVEIIVVVTDLVYDVAFVLNFGRFYYLLVIVFKELKIISLILLGYYSFGVFIYLFYLELFIY